MNLAVLILGLALAYYSVWLPIVESERRRREVQFEKEFRDLKLQYVRRRHYRFLRFFSFREIEEHFDVERAYRELFY